MIIAASCDSHLSVSAGGVREALWPSARLPFSMQGWLWPIRIEWGRTEKGVKGRVQTKGEWRILSVIAGGDILQLSDKLSSLCQMNSVGKNDYPNKEMSSTSLAVQKSLFNSVIYDLDLRIWTFYIFVHFHWGILIFTTKILIIYIMHLPYYSQCYFSFMFTVVLIKCSSILTEHFFLLISI